MSDNYAANIDELVPVNIEEEMQKSYLDYAMSVIVSRAIPDVRDGLKPVHRRILYAMYESGYDYNKAHRKSARIVGDVIGKYHPHGDASVYDALVRLAQNFSLRVPLVDGQGNFGSIDGDSAAAMRYTESRLAKVSHRLVEDIDKETVDFQANYDGSEHEPKVLPAMFPNLLVNGAGGIAVGMATNIPPHNLGEVIEACCAYIDQPDIEVLDLMQYVKGPDFPTGGVILGQAGIRSAISTGRGSIIMRGRAHFEEYGNRERIIITELPYMVNKAKMIERIAELVRDKKIEGISDLRDESNKQGIRVVVELKRDAVADVILNQLFSFTPLQSSFGVNMLALDNGRPKVMNLKDVVSSFVNFREEVITKRTIYLLNKAKNRAHLLIGLSIAVANIDEIIALIKSAKDPAEAKASLLNKAWKAANVEKLIELIADNSNKIENGVCYFTEEQAKAILEMRLQRLTAMEKDKIENELGELKLQIEDFLDIIQSRTRLLFELKQELNAVKDEFATPRLTEIDETEYEADIEALIPKEEMVVTITHSGYIKRVPLSTYRSQNRGGKGRAGLSMREDDITTQIFVGNTHTNILFFSDIGQVYKLKLYKLPLGNPQSKGRPFVNLLPLKENEKITQIMPLPEDEDTWDALHIMFATAKGNARRNSLSDFKRVQSNGKIAIRLEENDSLIGVQVCQESDHILLASRFGKAIRFPVTAIRVFKSRTSDGVRAMKLADRDSLISMTVLHGAEAPIEVRDNFLRIGVDLRQQIANFEETEVEELDAAYQQAETELELATLKEMAEREEFILTVTENGFGKRTSAYEYRITNRGGSGIVNMVTSERNGMIVASMPVNTTDDIMLITDAGKVIRCSLKNVRISGRNTSGVILFKTDKNEKVVSAALIADQDDERLEEMIDAEAEAGIEQATNDAIEDNKETDN